ncbi:alpha/beta hydrolase family protein [Haloactinopolyspora alba]|uniref:Alpha/beta hydrolase family protein n=1 Tax=Haloactinopolyspora alba TaxID=648780 RepID=A0A2P8DWH8_9ACTN|nr:alpha/beta fold hydrolase [Haloactinopolyspora alba]PSL01554.1 alpha/beta hydrolase family protein [Haloactinopolyspora alba]
MDVRSTIRNTLALAAAGLTLTTAGLAAAPGMPAAATPASDAPARPAAQVQAPVPELNWKPCEEGLEAFLCTTAEVPTDYDRPDGPTTTIALTKLPATDPDARIGTLFTNPGGPGGSGVDFVHTRGRTAYTDDVRAHFDILGFDPRAVHRSDPATCYRTPEQEQRELARHPAFPVTAEEENDYLGLNARLGADCRRTSPERFAHSSTANVARDMDLLRQAVGDEKLTYMGYSYGTLLGATYARLFPGRVRALALDGTVVPEDYTGRPGEETSSVGARMRQGHGAAETFDEFLRLCAEAGPRRCALAALGEPRTVVERTFDRLKDESVRIVTPNGTELVVDYPTAVALTFSGLYDPAAWTGLAGLLAQLATAEPQMTGAAAALVEQVVPQRDRPPRRGADYASVGGSLASLCVDGGTTGEPFAYPEMVDDVAADAAHFGRYRAWVGVQCEFLRVTDEDAYVGPWDQQVDEPVLVIGTRYDPATPYDGTSRYAAHFPDARTMTVEGYGHTVLGKSRCADRVISNYLVRLDAPADGSTCGQDVPPFQAPGARARRPLTVPPLPPLIINGMPQHGVVLFHTPSS